MLEGQEEKPKVDGKKPRRPFRPQKREFETKVTGLKVHTFDIGHAKYAAKYQSSLDEIILYVQEKYERGAVIAEAMWRLELPDIQLPKYPEPDVWGGSLKEREVFLWQQEVTEKKKALW
jgi:hypothetical protein